MITITYIGHATTLAESGGKAVLTDPNFSSHVLCFKRKEPLNYDPGKLPELSAVVISHAHKDHLNINSFRYIKGSVPVFVPVGLGKYLSQFIRNPVIEVNHYATHKLPDGVEITATEARHVGFIWSGLRYRRCNGYIMTFPKDNSQVTSHELRVFFAGDTAYGPHFKEIGNLYNGDAAIDIALLPIAGYSPLWFMKKRHMSPVEALEAFLDLGAKNMVPVHFGSFRLSAEKLAEPLEWLSRVAIERDLGERVHILRSGESSSL